VVDLVGVKSVMKLP